HTRSKCVWSADVCSSYLASRFCIHLRHDLHQCVIFDSNRPDARLIGIEYIISEERFRTLDEEEQQLWHSHHYEVKSGMLVAPGEIGRASCREGESRWEGQ